MQGSNYLIFIFPVPFALNFLFVMRNIGAFCILFLVTSAVYIIFVLRSRPVAVWHRFVLLGCIASASFHNKSI